MHSRHPTPPRFRRDLAIPTYSGGRDRAERSPTPRARGRDRAEITNASRGVEIAPRSPTHLSRGRDRAEITNASRDARPLPIDLSAAHTPCAMIGRVLCGSFLAIVNSILLPTTKQQKTETHRVNYERQSTRFHRAKNEGPRAPPGRHSPSFSAWKSASGRWETATSLPSNLRLANDLSAAAASLEDDLLRVRVNG